MSFFRSPRTNSDGDAIPPRVSWGLSVNPASGGGSQEMRDRWLASPIRVYQWWGAAGNTDNDPVKANWNTAHWGIVVDDAYTAGDALNIPGNDDQGNPVWTRKYLYRVEGVTPAATRLDFYLRPLNNLALDGANDWLNGERHGCGH